MKNRPDRVLPTIALLLALLTAAMPGVARTLKVGEGETYPVPSAASKAAKDGDTIEINAGIYEGDVAIWKQNNLTLRGVGVVELKAAGKAKQGKGIWVISGRNAVVENITFSGARVRDKNGAGIRQDGVNLTVRRCRFLDNENGILAGRNNKNSESEILIEDSVFERNGHSNGKAHGIYVGNLTRLTVRGSIFSESHAGHHIKSRARETHVLYNRIQDRQSGDSSYLIDLPQSGRGFVIGNVLQQGPRAQNNGIVSFGAEKNQHPDSVLFIVNNTMVNDRQNGVFIKNRQPDAKVYVYNNIFAGDGKISTMEVEAANNLIVASRADSPFVSWGDYDYRLTAGSKAIDAGRYVEAFEDVSLTPALEIRQGPGTLPRPAIGAIDIGAFEYRDEN